MLCCRETSVYERLCLRNKSRQTDMFLHELYNVVIRLMLCLHNVINQTKFVILTHVI